MYQDYLITGNELNTDEWELLKSAFKKKAMDKETLEMVLMLSDDFVSDIPKELEGDVKIAKILIAKDVSNLENVPADIC